MFVYGTLKRGHRNHSYCHGALRAREASVHGRLYDLPAGYPALVVPDGDVLAVGTVGPLRDVREAHRLKHQKVRRPRAPGVFGELYTFDDAEDRLPKIDHLEGFVPDDPTSPYRRVLLPVQVGGRVAPAWAYVVREARGTHLPEGRWPA